MNDANGKEISLRLLRLLKNNPELTQRQMNHEMGVSLGKINYCISGFVQEGLVKVETFRKSKKRSRYIYHLTPRGIEEIARLTFRFLEMRIKEYNRIKKEIQQLSDQMNEIDPGLLAGLTEDLEKIKI